MKVFTLGKGLIAGHLPYPKITDRIETVEDIDRIFEQYKPDVLVNAIGFCGSPNVDECENRKTDTYTANVTIPSLLARRCEQKNIHLIHFGSGCVFFGKSPRCAIDHWGEPRTVRDLGWKEDDHANPQSHYSKTKYACDLTIGGLPNITILRLRMPMTARSEPRNFINKIIKYNRVINVPNSVTFVEDLVRCVDWAIDNERMGIWHVTNPEPITAAQVAMEWKKHRPTHEFSLITEQELGDLTVAKRSNCLLNTDKLIEAGFEMTPSLEAMQYCVKSVFDGG